MNCVCSACRGKAHPPVVILQKCVVNTRECGHLGQTTYALRQPRILALSSALNSRRLRWRDTRGRRYLPSKRMLTTSTDTTRCQITAAEKKPCDTTSEALGVQSRRATSSDPTPEQSPADTDWQHGLRASAEQLACSPPFRLLRRPSQPL